MTRYWFEFKFNDFTKIPHGLACGCGVTAFDLTDALKIIKENIFPETEIPEIKIQKENVDIRTLDTGHVIPNMIPPNTRGIWFPIGYQD